MGSIQNIDFAQTTWLDIGATFNFYVSGGAMICGIGSMMEDNVPIMCSKYKNVDTQGVDKRIYVVNHNLIIVDSDYTDATVFKNAMKGILMAYKLPST